MASMRLPAYRIFPEALPDTQQVIETVQRSGYDGVIVTVGLPRRARNTCPAT
jgi:hypothetical protein